jgi:hypothetical protein
VVARALIVATMEATQVVARSSPRGVSSSSRGLMVAWARRHVVARALIAWAGCCVIAWARRHVGLSSRWLLSHGLIIAWSRELVIPWLVVTWARLVYARRRMGSSSCQLVVASAQHVVLWPLPRPHPNIEPTLPPPPPSVLGSPSLSTPLL